MSTIPKPQMEVQDPVTVDPNETLYTPAGSHLPENLSTQPIDLILVELKR